MSHGYRLRRFLLCYGDALGKKMTLNWTELSLQGQLNFPVCVYNFQWVCLCITVCCVSVCTLNVSVCVCASWCWRVCVCSHSQQQLPNQSSLPTSLADLPAGAEEAVSRQPQSQAANRHAAGSAGEVSTLTVTCVCVWGFLCVHVSELGSVSRS